MNITLHMAIDLYNDLKKIALEEERSINGEICYILKKYIEDNNLDTYIEADGGINKNTINEAKQAGIDIAVAGSAIISAENFKTAIAELK